MDEKLKKLSNVLDVIVRVISISLALCFFAYGFLLVWDMYRTEINAFASYDLLQYRPNIEEDEPPYLDELIKINKDTKGWITMYGTHIDYPIMQGDTDIEYINKDYKGEHTISGSIFLSCLNAPDFSDSYNLLYGHHMDNGSMFGDLDEYLKKDFFNKNETGVLIKQNEVYNLFVIGVLEVDAHDYNVYHIPKGEEEIDSFISYVKDVSTHYRKQDDVKQVCVLSTCKDATSFQRTVLVCKMEYRTEPLPLEEDEPDMPFRYSVGHPMAGAYWAFFNLLAMLCSIYILFPFGYIKEKYKKIDKRYMLIESFIVICSIVLFTLTEDMHKPIQIVDGYSVFMLLFVMLLGYLEYRQYRKNEKIEEEV